MKTFFARPFYSALSTRPLQILNFPYDFVDKSTPRNKGILLFWEGTCTPVIVIFGVVLNVESTN